MNALPVKDKLLLVCSQGVDLEEIHYNFFLKGIVPEQTETFKMFTNALEAEAFGSKMIMLYGGAKASYITRELLEDRGIDIASIYVI